MNGATAEYPIAPEAALHAGLDMPYERHEGCPPRYKRLMRAALRSGLQVLAICQNLEGCPQLAFGRLRAGHQPSRDS